MTGEFWVMISEVWTLSLSCWTLLVGLFLLGRYVTACAFSPTAPLIATGSMDKSVNIWKVEDGSSAQGGFIYSEYGSILLYSTL